MVFVAAGRAPISHVRCQLYMTRAVLPEQETGTWDVTEWETGISGAVMYLEYFRVDRPSPAWAQAQATHDKTAVSVRGLIIYIKAGDWFADLRVASVIVTTEDVMLLFSREGHSLGSGFGRASIRKDTIVSWETIIPTSMAEDYLKVIG